MKKFLVLAALALVVAVGVAESGIVAPSRAFKQLQFRTHVAGAQQQDAVGGYVDSAYAGGAAKFDTTTAFDVADLTTPGTLGSLDSVEVVRLYVWDWQDGTAATAESIYVKTQVSVDGDNWTDVACIPGQAPVLNAWTLQTTVNGAVFGFTSSTNTGRTGKMWSLGFNTGVGAASLKMGNDVNHVHLFPKVRFILSGSRTLAHQWKAGVGYWTANAAR